MGQRACFQRKRSCIARRPRSCFAVTPASGRNSNSRPRPCDCALGVSASCAAVNVQGNGRICPLTCQTASRKFSFRSGRIALKRATDFISFSRGLLSPNEYVADERTAASKVEGYALAPSTAVPLRDATSLTGFRRTVPFFVPFPGLADAIKTNSPIRTTARNCTIMPFHVG